MPATARAWDLSVADRRHSLRHTESMVACRIRGPWPNPSVANRASGKWCEQACFLTNCVVGWRRLRRSGRVAPWAAAASSSSCRPVRSRPARLPALRRWGPLWLHKGLQRRGVGPLGRVPEDGGQRGGAGGGGASGCGLALVALECDLADRCGGGPPRHRRRRLSAGAPPGPRGESARRHEELGADMHSEGHSRRPTTRHCGTFVKCTRASSPCYTRRAKDARRGITEPSRCCLGGDEEVGAVGRGEQGLRMCLMLGRLGMRSSC